ncbi:hypothetical protein Slin14017_G009270 [Septoria linicola]|nr:hypothetical protein Slin14017_G009270 [Septoria linicola]
MAPSASVPPLSNAQPYRPTPSASSSFGSISSDDSHFLNTLPSAMIGDFPVSDFYPWRDSNSDQSWDQQPLSDRHATAHFDSTAHTHSRLGFCNDQARRSLLELPQQSAGDQASHSARSPTLLTGPVDTSDFEHVEDMHWACSVTEYDDDAASPATVDTHSSGPRTPASSQHGGALVHPYADRKHDIVPKVETAFDPFPSASPMPSLMPAINPENMSAQGHTLPNAASFGHITLAAAFPQPPMWPMTAITPHGAYHTHTHGLPTGGPGLVTNYDLYQGVHPSAVQPVFPTEPDTFEDLGGTSPDNSPENFSESESEVDADDKLDEDMNDRALHDAQARRDRDKYLLKMRNEGFSYKEIKRRGNFREAESTLRGRVRVLTKDKADRVRRPEWTEDDLRLLDRAVSRFSGTHGRGRGRDGGRLPWKKVAEYLVQHGSSYHFAAATCARKWKEIE